MSYPCWKKYSLQHGEWSRAYTRRLNSHDEETRFKLDALQDAADATHDPIVAHYHTSMSDPLPHRPTDARLI